MADTEQHRPTGAPTASGPGAASGARADETAGWRGFFQASTQDAFYEGWLANQCQLIPGAHAGVVFAAAPGTSRFAPAAVWPAGADDLEPLLEAAKRVVSDKRGVVLRRAGGQGGNRVSVAYPAVVGSRLTAVVALDLSGRGDAELQAVLRQLEWGTGWFEVFARRQAVSADPGTRERLQAVLDLVASALEQERFFGAASAFATALATRLACDRVTIGFATRGRARVRAMSHSAHFGKRTDLVRAIGAAMDEAIDQQATVAVPAPSEAAPRIARAHEVLVARHGSSAVCTVPFADGSQMAGAVVLERTADQPFDASTIELAEAAATLVGPMLDLRRRDDRWLGAKALDTARRQLGHLVGPRHVGLKLGVLAVIAASAVLVLAQGDYRVSARTVMEAAERRAAVAPFGGFLREAPARAGDVVRRGQLLATLDDRELRLERTRWASQLEQYAKQQSAALAARSAAQVSIAGAQIAQAQAQLALVEDQLARMRVVAGFDGVVVTGDLSQAIGSPVERGQVLFEIAPLAAYRVVLQVDERDVSDVKVGQAGQLLLAAAPSEPLVFSVEKITPVSTAREGRNYFRVEAKLQGGAERLRPGMEGVAKVEIGRRQLVAIWLRPVIDWARLAAWTWLP